MIGKTVAQYKVLQQLGQGGMGIVYKAEDTKLGRKVALKFLPPHLSTSEQDKARFLQEAQAASALNHPNVCTIHDIQEHDGQTFIVMEYVEGFTLRDRPQPYTIKQVVEIGIQIADGLAAGCAQAGRYLNNTPSIGAGQSSHWNEDHLRAKSASRPKSLEKVEVCREGSLGSLMAPGSNMPKSSASRWSTQRGS